MTTAKELSDITKYLPEGAKVYVQSGYNRFEITTFTMDANSGDILLVLAEEANNPKVIPVTPEPLEKALA